MERLGVPVLVRVVAEPIVEVDAVEAVVVAMKLAVVDAAVAMKLAALDVEAVVVVEAEVKAQISSGEEMYPLRRPLPLC